MSTLTTSNVAIANYLMTLLENNQTSLGLHSVWYGDQNKLPGTPVVCVEPDNKSNVYNGAPRRVWVTMRSYVLIYYAKVGSPEDNRLGADTLAESIEKLIHADRTMGGLVVNSLCENVESGYVAKSGTLVRGSRIIVAAESQGQLPS